MWRKGVGRASGKPWWGKRKVLAAQVEEENKKLLRRGKAVLVTWCHFGEFLVGLDDLHDLFDDDVDDDDDDEYFFLDQLTQSICACHLTHQKWTCSLTVAAAIWHQAQQWGLPLVEVAIPAQQFPPLKTISLHFFLMLKCALFSQGVSWVKR